jgi:hypothetical protein
MLPQELALVVLLMPEKVHTYLCIRGVFPCQFFRTQCLKVGRAYKRRLW